MFKALFISGFIMLGLFAGYTYFEYGKPVDNDLGRSVADKGRIPKNIKADSDTVFIDRLAINPTAAIDTADVNLSVKINRWIQQGRFKQARDYLLEMAAQAVDTDDDEALGNALLLLGQVSIEELDLYDAEVYLQEALDVYQRQGNEGGMAYVYYHLGRVHVKTRATARKAAKAYDRLLLARWQLTHQQYDLAESGLRQIIADNMDVHRYGAAASAYKTLTKLYVKTNQPLQAENSAVESAQLYAMIGQLQQAKTILSKLEALELEPNRLLAIEQNITDKYAVYQAQMDQVERAQDYRRLYNHYRAKGDMVRAWNFRLLANKALASFSKTMTYRRQPDVLAILYNSNNNIADAERYIALAKALSDKQDMRELTIQSQQLSSQIY